MRSYLATAMMIGFASVAGAQDRSQPTMRFAGMDTNNDGVITQREWRGSPQAFRQQDWNGDGILSGDEVRPGARRPDRQVRGSGERGAYMDANDDGLITRAEWRGTAERFDALDDNRDGVLMAEELTGDRASVSDLFALADRNGDGVLTREEWPWSDREFDDRDDNRDGRLTAQEARVGNATGSEYRSEAWRLGRERGLIEGRQAGKEDKDRNQGWDLEGQRELETADSGYEPRFGARADYQAGYREGFRRGYREGYGPR